MDEKFYRNDLDYCAIIPNEVNGTTTYNIGEFDDSFINGAYYVFEVNLPTVEIAVIVCRAMVEAFNDGQNYCGCS